MAKKNDGIKLHDLFDQWDVGRMDQRNFVLHIGHTDMYVSRSYLENDAWRYLLGRKVSHYEVAPSIYGNVVHIYLEGRQ